MTTIEAPRTRAKRSNVEKWGWMYMRLSGVLLIILIFGHLIVNLVLGNGVHQIDFAFVGGKWSNPFWQVWDALMLVLALIHGANGMRTIVNDYATKRATRGTFKVAIAVATVVLIVLGLLVVFTFDPCPTDAPANLLPSVCKAG